MPTPFKERVLRTLQKPSLMAERHRWRSTFSPSLSYGRHFGPPLPSARQAAVMILLEPRPEGWTIPLTVRPPTLPDHGGQVSFPGGRLEGSESHHQAAKREFAEELGISPFPAETIGELQPLYVYNSNYYVQPFVAVADRTFEYRPCPQEVERLIHLPVSTLIDPRQHLESSFSRGLVSWQARHFQYQSDRIWGATAIMLAELAAILGDTMA